MICYRDTTFCISPNCVNACGRELTDEVRAGAKRWGGPIATAYFCGPPTRTIDRPTTPPEEDDGEDAMPTHELGDPVGRA